MVLCAPRCAQQSHDLNQLLLIQVELREKKTRRLVALGTHVKFLQRAGPGSDSGGGTGGESSPTREQTAASPECISNAPQSSIGDNTAFDSAEAVDVAHLRSSLKNPEIKDRLGSAAHQSKL